MTVTVLFYDTLVPPALPPLGASGANFSGVKVRILKEIKFVAANVNIMQIG